MSTPTTHNEIAIPADWREEWSRELAQPLADTAAASDSSAMLVFRLGAERFALAATGVVEITPVPVIHRVPSRDPASIGLVNVRGRVAVCASLAPLLGPLPPSGEPPATSPHLVVLRAGEWIFATRVDAVEGVHRLDHGDLAAPPPPAAAHRFTIGLWTINGHSVARLDEARLFAAVKESLA